MRLLSISLVLFCFCVKAQKHPLAAFDNLVNKTWIINGTWGNGNPFEQQVTFSYQLNKTIVVAETQGFVDSENSKKGQRNFGIRQLNQTDSTISFYEFDVFGGLTKGEVLTKNQDILYIYQYGDLTLIDSWTFISLDEYLYKVMTSDSSQTFLEARAIRQ